METIEFVYIVCLFLGLGFAVLSALLAGVFSGGAEAHVEVGGGGHADLGHGIEGHVQFPILSPVVIAMFVTTFGGAGLLLKRFLLWPLPGHLAGSAAAGAGVALATAYLLYKMFQATSAGAPPGGAEAVGLEAEVTVPIPHQGLGEIAFTVQGSRLTSPARTEDGKELPAQTVVKILKQVGNFYLVRKNA
jgi:hypothetical protein